MLDSDAQKLLDLIASKMLPSYDTLSPAQARTFYRERRFFSQPDPQPVGAVHDLAVPGPEADIAVRHYRPHGSAPDRILPALVYYHGGGHTIGDLDTHDLLCRELCNLSERAVFSVDYRLGPENKFPAAVDDSFAALQWIAGHAAELMIDPAKIAVGGDSAGANLAAVMALTARDQGGLRSGGLRSGGPRLTHQLLIYPVTDFRFQTESQSTNGQGYLLTREVIDYFTDCYLGSAEERLDWRVSPALAANFSNLPAALVLTAGYDPLHDEGEEYANCLRAAGNPVEYVCYPGQIHGFITMGKVIRQANEAVALCAEWLRVC